MLGFEHISTGVILFSSTESHYSVRKVFLVLLFFLFFIFFVFTPPHPKISRAYRTNANPRLYGSLHPASSNIAPPSSFHLLFSSALPFPTTSRSRDATTLITGFMKHVINRHTEVNFSRHFHITQKKTLCFIYLFIHLFFVRLLRVTSPDPNNL